MPSRTQNLPRSLLLPKTTRLWPPILGIFKGVEHARIPSTKNGVGVEDALNVETRGAVFGALPGQSTVSTPGTGRIAGLESYKAPSAASEKLFAAVDGGLMVDNNPAYNAPAEGGGLVAVAGTNVQFASLDRHTFFVDGTNALRRYDHADGFVYPVTLPGTPAAPTINVESVTDSKVDACDSITGLTYLNDIDAGRVAATVETAIPVNIDWGHTTDGAGAWHIDSNNVYTGDLVYKVVSGSCPTDWSGYTDVSLGGLFSGGRENRTGGFLEFVFGPGATYDPATAHRLVVPISSAGVPHNGTKLSLRDVLPSERKSVGYYGFRVNSGLPDVGFPDGEFVVWIDDIRLSQGLTGTRYYKLVAVHTQGAGANIIRLPSPDSPASIGAVFGTGGKRGRVFLAPRTWTANTVVVAGERVRPVAGGTVEYVYTTGGTTHATTEPTYPTGTAEATDGTAKLKVFGTVQAAPSLWRLFGRDETIEAEYHLVAEVTGTSTFYVDTVADLSGVTDILQQSRQGPPVGASVIQVHQGRIVLAGSPEDPHGVFFSNLEEVIPVYTPGWVTFYRLAKQDSSTFTFVIADGHKRGAGDDVVALAPLGVQTGLQFTGDLLYLCETHWRRLTGNNPNDWDDGFENGIGLVGPNAWCNDENGNVYMVSPAFDVWRIAEKLDPVRMSLQLHEYWRRKPPSKTDVVLGYDHLSARLVLTLTEDTSRVSYALDLEAGSGWVRLPITDVVCRTVRNRNEDGATLVVGTSDGKIVRVFDPAAARGPWSVRGRMEEPGGSWKHQWLSADGAGTVTLVDDTGAVLYGPVALDQEFAKEILPPYCYSRNWQMVIEGAAGDEMEWVELVSKYRGTGRDF